MPQATGPAPSATSRPSSASLPIHCWRFTLIRPVSVATVEVQQQPNFPWIEVIHIRSRTLDTLLYHGAGTALSCPSPEETSGGAFDEDGLGGFIFHEPEEGVWRGWRIGEDSEVDYVGGRLVDVGLGRGEGAEVGCVGVADSGVGWGACVPCVTCGVEFGSPEDHVLSWIIWLDDGSLIGGRTILKWKGI